MLNVDHVRKDFGSVHAVSDVHFTIADGTTFGLLGPNGAGKTTTMRMILGILVPDGGSVSWNGAPIDDDSRRHFGYLPEERGIYGKMKVREQIAYFGKLHGLRDPDLSKRVDRWIDQLGLATYADRPCGELSKGNQQKVQVACAAVHAPQLLVLDEPFSGLDPVNADVLLGVLDDLRKSGTTLILSAIRCGSSKSCARASASSRAAQIASMEHSPNCVPPGRRASFVSRHQMKACAHCSSVSMEQARSRAPTVRSTTGFRPRPTSRPYYVRLSTPLR